jgi:hypothetical protein
MNAEMLIATIDPDSVQDLLDEVGDKNYVRVVKHEFKKNHGLISFKDHLMEDGGKQTATIRGLAKYDSLRMLSGKKPIYLDEALRRNSGGELMSVGRNLRTNIGTDFVAATLGGVQLLMADWIALSNNTSAANATHSSSSIPWSSNQNADVAAGTTTGEFTVLGVARKLATYAHTASTANYTQAATWTSSGTTTSLQIAGLFGGTAKTAFNASNAANVAFVESVFTATSLTTNDQLTLTWTINI